MGNAIVRTAAIQITKRHNHRKCDHKDIYLDLVFIIYLIKNADLSCLMEVASFIASHTVCFLQFHEQNFDQFKFFKRYQLHYVSVSLATEILFTANCIERKRNIMSCYHWLLYTHNWFHKWITELFKWEFRGINSYQRTWPFKNIHLSFVHKFDPPPLPPQKIKN